MPLSSLAQYRPFAVAKYCLIAFSAAVLAFLVLNADAPDVVLMSVVVLPWIVGPAAMAALLVWCSKSRGLAWCFVVAELAMVGSTVLSAVTLGLKPDAQNGLSLLMFPLFQFVALHIYAGIVLGFTWLSRRNLLA